MHRHPSVSLAFLLSLAISAAASEADNFRDDRQLQLMVKSVLLSKHQCQLAVKGYSEKIAPNFAEWARAHREPLFQLEQSGTLRQHQREIEQRFAQLSKRARAGVLKDCETLLQKLRKTYGH